MASKNLLYITLLFVVSLSSCYSFKGITIPVTVNTFYVNLFDNDAQNVVPNLSLDFTEKLKDKIRSESRLDESNTDPDIEFKGTITQYRVSSEAPTTGETTAFNRLTITIAVEYINNQDEEDNWKQNFSFFNDFPSSQNLLSVQDELIENINDQLVEDIFNKAFTNW